MDATPTLSRHEIVSANLRMILCALLATLGFWRLDARRAVLLYRRIGGVAGRIERMLVRLRAGRLWCVTQRVSGQVRRGRVQPDHALPRRFGWLVQAGGYQAAGLGSQLQAVLNTPDMVELLAASAQARRILRPLCRALALELPASVAASPHTATACCSPPLQRRKPRPKPEPFRIPLPRGALAAAKREGFGKHG